MPWRLRSVTPTAVDLAWLNITTNDAEEGMKHRMWYSENWKDYELLDASDGERLERWGDRILIRPDPQIIWKGVAKHPLWKQDREGNRH
mgnify:CR=1 FL=1